MELRLQKVLAQAGVASRRRAEELIAEGRVEVNGKVVREMGTKVDPNADVIRVDGRPLADKERKVYFVLYKPVDMVTTLSDPQGRPTIADCLKGIDERVFAVGRLDWDAEGALLLTNDGELANRLMHPKFQVPRTYLAKVKGEPDAATVAKLREGVLLEDGFVRPDHVEVERETEKNTWLRLVVSEGRPHLVKRLCAAVGHPVVRLFRPQYAGVGVDGLQPGRYRRLTEEEVAALKRSGPKSLAPETPVRMPARRHRAPGVQKPGGQEPESDGRDSMPAGRSFVAQDRPRERSSAPRSSRLADGGRRSTSERPGQAERPGRTERPSSGRNERSAGRSERPSGRGERMPSGRPGRSSGPRSSKPGSRKPGGRPPRR